MSLVLTFSCVKYIVPESDLSLEGMWAPVEEGSCTDKYLEFRMGKCYTYITPKILYVGEGKIWGCHIDDFYLMSAEEYFIKDGKLVIGGSNVGDVRFDGDDMVCIGGNPFQQITELTSDVYKSRAISQLTILYHGTPVHKTGEEDFVLNLLCGDVDEFDVVITPSDAVDRSLFWYSDSPEVVSVSQDGSIIANGNGEAWINVYSKNDYEVKDRCKVVVSTFLARNGVANSYIAPRSGHYIFPAKRNTLNNDGELEYVDHASLLWATYNTGKAPAADGLVKNVFYDENERMISFDLDFGDAKGGNAVIAAMDASDKVIWSWHIWAARGFDPDAHAEAYMLDGDKVGPVCMDRNLGSLSASVGNENESFGLFYQWGRKDPFLCAVGKTNYSPVASYCPAGWNVVVADGETGTVDYAVANPTTFITSAGIGWVTGGTSQATLWSPSEKTVFDPCPPGWRLPGIELWKTPGESGNGLAPFVDNENRALQFRNLVWNPGGWYPASGYLSGNPGMITAIGSLSYVFSASTSNSAPLALEFSVSATPTVNYSSAVEFDFGCQVRCVLQTSDDELIEL